MPKTPPRDIKQGDIIAGRYEVRGAVGRGGMGRIYRVFDKILGEEVALKTLLPDHVDDKIVLERFFNEARIARNLSHPNIVRVHDIGQAQDTVYISMELLKGKSLRQMLDQLQPGQRLPIAGILRMFDALCAALDYAHHFTVHRDIKPENVMILTDGSLKLMDFGISKLKANPNLTSASIVMGTPTYMAPEQLRNTSTVDARADVYSIGVMLYEVLTGDRPSGLARPASKIHGEVPAALDPIIEKCCNPDPNKRYQSAGELRAALRAIRVEIERRSTSGESIGTLTRPVERSRSAAGRYAVAAIVLLALAAIAYGGLTRAEARRQRASTAAPSGIVTGPAGAVDQGDPDVREFARLEQRMSALQQEAAAAKLEYAEVQQLDVIDPVIQRGDALWAAAQNLRDSSPSGALELAWDAAGCYVAVAHWPENMVFILPAAPGEAPARGFFLDARPVSAGDFADFCDAHPWDWPEQAPRLQPDEPMSSLAYFDAQAYLAASTPPKKLPSTAEFNRALAQFIAAGAVRPAGEVPAADESAANDEESEPPLRTLDTNLEIPNFAGRGTDWREWTSSIENLDDTAVPTFGDRVLTIVTRWTGPRRPTALESRPQFYEWPAPDVGFRGKQDLPRSIREIGEAR